RRGVRHPRAGGRRLLTVDCDRLGVRPGMRAIDVGAGLGRHTFELYKRGADVTGFDQNADEMREVGEWLAAMEAEGEGGSGARGEAVVGDALAMPYEDGTLDRKSTRLNSSHVSISYAVFCLKQKHLT